MDRCCIVHIGLHKTGSTTIQKMLKEKKSWLGEQGIYVPQSGIPFAEGHHLLAGEVNEKPGADHAGQFKRLRDELAAAGLPERVVLSSEEFSARIHEPRIVRRLKRRIMRLGYRARIIAYVRPQETALQAMYTQRLKVWSITSDFDAFWPKAVQQIRFDYERRFSALLEEDEIDVRIFPFAKGTIGNGLCRHFLSILGIPAEALAGFIEPPPSNVSPGPKTVAAALAIAKELEHRGMRVSKENMEAGAFLLRRLGRTMGSEATKFNALTPEIVHKIRAKFRDSNGRFAARAFGREWDEVFAAEQATLPSRNMFLRELAAPEEQREFDEFVAHMTEIILAASGARNEGET